MTKASDEIIEIRYLSLLKATQKECAVPMEIARNELAYCVNMVAAPSRIWRGRDQEPGPTLSKPLPSPSAYVSGKRRCL